MLAGGELPVPKSPELPFGQSPKVWSLPQTALGSTKRVVYKGNVEAKLVVVEFSDFQCPSCRRHALETLPEPKKRHIETGKVIWFFKHLTLKMHLHAPAAAVAAECAGGKQKKIWEKHRLLFNKQDAWSKGESDQELVEFAQHLGLNKPEFESCINSRKALEKVLQDIYDAQGVIQNTPAFMLIYDDKA